MKIFETYLIKNKIKVVVIVFDKLVMTMKGFQWICIKNKIDWNEK